MDISALQAFISVARHGSFSKASEHLFITQPAVSKRVASLEEELGVKLFNRIARQVSLTDAGEQLFQRAADLVSQADDMQRFASNLNDVVSGQLSVAISHHIGLHRMPPILRAFNQRYPSVMLDIRFEDSDQAFSEVERGDIEFAVITLPSKLSDALIRQTVWKDELFVVASQDHPLANHANPSLRHVSDYPCVLPGNETETHQIILREFSSRRLPMTVQMETNNLETLKMLVNAGVGWSLLPSTMVDASIRKIDLQLPLSRDLGIVSHSKRSLSNAARALKNMIEHHAE